MTISLLVPVFNAASYIDSFLENLGQLSMPFDEILFYNDGSTDNSAEILRSKGFSVIGSNINQGPGYARNRLADASTTDYIHFHDIDDQMAASFVDSVKSRFRNSPDVIIGHADWINAETKIVEISWRYAINDIRKDPLSYFIQHPLGIINTVYKKTKFSSIGGFDEKIKCWEDSDIHVRFAANDAKFELIDEVLATSLRHENGISQNQTWCWTCRVKFLEHYIGLYRNLNPAVVALELKKATTAFIKMGAFKNLKIILDLNNQYHLPLNLKKIRLLYYLTYIFPKRLIIRMLNIQRDLLQLKIRK